MRYFAIRLLKTIRDTLRYVKFFYSDSRAIKNLNKSDTKNLLIIKTDAIGDYVLFRNFLKELRKDKKYSDYKITLCGNSVWKDIAKRFDSNFVDEFYWINRNKFLKDISYRGKVLGDINKKDFGVTINPTYSREFFTDTLIRASRSKDKIGNAGDCENTIWWQKRLSDRYYTRLIKLNKKLNFEFYRYRNFFEKFLGRNVSVDNTSLKVKREEGEYAVLFTIANAKRRMWSMDNFMKIKEYLEKTKGLKVYVVDKNLPSINDLIDLVAGAKIVVSNDTSASHISAACDASLVCILHGRHFGRFSPYPKKIYDKGIFLYPPKIMERMNDFDYLSKKYKFFSTRNINEVTVEKVKESIDKLLP